MNIDSLLPKIGDARFVMLGEASHGTAEYYLRRFEISQRLIQEFGFQFIAVEGDWPHCFVVNRHIKHLTQQRLPSKQVLNTFDRWPTWMWANEEVAGFISWLEEYNLNKEYKDKIGFYGLDLYSLLDSLVEIINFLKKEDPGFLQLAYDTYRCFRPYGTDMHNYGFAAELTKRNCTDEVLQLLDKMPENNKLQGPEDEDKFSSRMNALAVKNSEEYYRMALKNNSESWNVRDRHMMECLNEISDFYGSHSKGIVWAHNTHIGDARFTDMYDAGMVNIGQLARERFPNSTALVGFGSYEGTVIASDRWDGPARKISVPKALRGSWESILHEYFEGTDGLIIFGQEHEDFFNEIRGNRAIGVVYNPESEYGNYVPTILSKRYDAFVFIDQTSALTPLEVPVKDVEVDETFPSGV